MQEVLCLLKSNRTSKHSWSTSTQACFLPCRRGPEPAAEVLCLSLLLSRNLQPSGSLLGCCCFLPKCFPSIVMGVYTACSFLSCKHISLLCHRLPERAVCGPQFEALCSPHPPFTAVDPPPGSSFSEGPAARSLGPPPASPGPSWGCHSLVLIQ